MAHFNDRVQVREVDPGSLQDGSVGQRTHNYPGARADVLREYSAPLANASYERESPPLENPVTVDFQAQNCGNGGFFNAAVRRRDELIPNWHIKRDGMVYQGEQHTSVVAEIYGNAVITASGSRYRLTNRDPRIKDTMNHILDAYRNSPTYRSEEPLRRDTLDFLFAAEMLVYGDFRPYADEVEARLIRLAKSEATMVSVEDVSPIDLVRTSYVP